MGFQPSFRLTTVALVVLASLLLAAAVQIGARVTEIGAYDRSRAAIAVVGRLRDIDAALAATDLDAPPVRLRADIAGVVAAMDRATAFVAGRDSGRLFDADWTEMRREWSVAHSAADLERLSPFTETTLRSVLLKIGAFALTRGSHHGFDTPLSEAALLAIPSLAVQDERLGSSFDHRHDMWDDDHRLPETIAIAERIARAKVIGSIGFVAFDMPESASGLPLHVIEQATAAEDASEAFIADLERSLVAGTVASRRDRIAGRGHAAAQQLDALEATLLPLLDARIAAARASAVRDIALIVVLVAAVFAFVVILSLQAMRAQSRSVRSREALEHQAMHDALTGLPNRRAFADAIERVVGAWTPVNDRTTWVLSIDLDYFKEVNDRYGHQTGDEFLIAAAQRLRDAVPPDDFVARVGGDEFAVLVRNFDPDSAHALEVGQRICEAFNEPIVVAGVRHRLAASVGLVAVDALHETVDSLLRDADIAMYTAKEAGGDRVVVFDDLFRQSIVYRAELAADLRSTLAEDGPIGVAFQPILSIDRAQCYGFEALVRWQHPVHGRIPAGMLIDIAQEARLIDDLGRHIVHEVCRHLADWRRAGLDLEVLSVHFNISPMEAVHAHTFGSIAHALEAYAIPPRTLVVELTETASMDSIEAANIFLSQLHAIDVRICLDDFGTGYSSLRHLNDFHVDAIKIDRSFVVSAAEDDAKVPIIAGIIALARGLNADVIAEGIETLEQAAVVERLGCRLVQGYLYSLPLSPDDALAFAQRAYAAPSVS